MDSQDSTPIVTSRKDAKAQGLKFYFTGKPCKRGHIAERYLSTGTCIICNSDNCKARDPEKSKERCHQWKIKNKEKVSAYNQKWNAENAELRSSLGKEWRAANKEKHTADLAAWRINNKAKAADSWKAWYAANKEKVSVSKAAWRKSNRDLSRVYIHRRRALLLNAEGTHSAQDIKDLYASQKGRCAYCKVKVGGDYHVDHIQPLIKGGRNDRENLQICCPACNLRKRDKDPIKFAQELGFLL